MVNTVKFSDFPVANINDSSTQDVGLSSGVNTRESKFYTWTTAGRPTSPFNGLLGLNTTLQQYEFWDNVARQWTQFADSNVFAVLASHAAGQGASLIGLQDQSHVTSKFVQDLANATFIAQTDNGSLQNAQFLGSLTTGIVKNTTVTGVLSISAPLTSIDSLTTALGDTLYVSAPNTYVNLAGNTTTTKQFLSQTGTGVISAAPAWSTISAGDIVSPAALTKTDDTNVTLTLGGSPTVALLAATSLTLGWTGQLGLTRGGTNASLTAVNGGILYSTASALAISAAGSSGQLLQSAGAATPVWTTATYPATTTINQLLYSSAGNTVTGLATANSAVLVTSAGGVPSLSTTLPNINIGTPSAGVLTNCTGLPIAGITGLGTGVATALAANVSGSGGIALATTGTFTATVGGSGANPTSVTYSNQAGKYTQIGNVVYFSANVAITALTIGAASGNLQINGLPISSVNTSGLNNQIAITYANLNLAASTTTVTGWMNPGTPAIVFFESFNNGANQIIPVTNLTASSQIYVSGFYFAS